MKETRRIDIRDKVFAVGDLRRFAGLLEKAKASMAAGESWTRYQITFEDDVRLEGTAAEIFSEEELIRPSRVVEVEMSLYSHSDEQDLTIRLNAGDQTYGNIAIIGGTQPETLRANYASLQEAIQKVKPQAFWGRRHPTLLLNLIALGTGTIGDLIIGGLVQQAIVRWPNLINAFPFPHPGSLGFTMLRVIFFPALILHRWLLRWLLGFAWWAFPIRRWILSMWPGIEFDFGAPYLKAERRREKLLVVMTLLVCPILVSALYDILKGIFH